MYYTSVEQQSRSVTFDLIKEKGNEVLKNPKIMRALGGITSELLAAWDSTFLPQVRHGVASLPRQERFTNGFALLPLSPDEWHGKLRLDSTMYEPTKRRQEAFYAAGGTHQELVRKTSEFAVRWGAAGSIVTEGQPMETFVAHATAPDTFFTSRPIMYCVDSLGQRGPLTVGRLATHETIHGLQGERETEAQLAAAEQDPVQMQLHLAEAELEAYHSGAVILRAVGYSPQSDIIDFQVAALSEQQGDRAAFVGSMVALDVIPTLEALAAQI